MAGLEPDCTMVAAVFAFIYTIVNGILFFGSIFTLCKYCRDYGKNVQRRPPKALFYPGLIFFVFSSFALLATARNSMTICFHGDTNYLDFNYWIYFIIFYATQTYLLWLILFLRLKYVFKGSVYKLSKLTTRIHAIIFIFIPFATPIYFIILSLVKSNIIYTLILLASFIFIITFSCSLSILFIYKLFQVFKNMDNAHHHHHHISNKTNKNTKKYINNKLLQTITKSTILAVISLTMTLLTPITLLFGYYAISYVNNNQILIEAASSLLSFCSLFDVFTNYFCILLSYTYFHSIYLKLCGKCDKKCRIFCITKIIKKKSTKSGHIEISSSKTSVTMNNNNSVLSASSVTVITPTTNKKNIIALRSKSISSASLSYKPNGDLYDNQNKKKKTTIYEQVDTDFDIYDEEDEEQEEQEEELQDNFDNDALPTPYGVSTPYDVQDTPNYHIPEQPQFETKIDNKEGEGLLHTL